MLDAVKTRLETQIPDLAGRVGKAAEFSKALKSGTAPRGGVNVYVLPSTTTGLPATSMGAGVFIQPVRRGISVASVIQSTDALGKRALDRIDGFLIDIQEALCGWAPGDEVGVFELVAERYAPTPRGLLAYLTEFRINDQLRILT